MSTKTAFLLLIILISNLVFAESKILTQLESSGYGELTSHSRMMTYLNKIDSLNKIVNISIIGKSSQGREIPALFYSLDKKFGSKRSTKPLVLIFCQQHGNEPSGKEAALILARELIYEKKYLLKKLDLILIPMVNPDGNENDTRQNGNEVDLNRNHWLLSEPEVLALHDLFIEWMPEVTLDVHEYSAVSKSWISSGMMKNVDEMMGSVTNLNIDESIMEFARQDIMPDIGQLIEKDDFSFHRYIVGSPFDDGRMRYSTTAINDGRQSLGIYNTLSFILEGKKYGDSLNLIEKRTKGQLSALTAFLTVSGDNSKTILKIVNKARVRLSNPPKNADRMVHIQMDYYQDATDSVLKFPIFDLYDWRGTVREFDCFHSKVKVRKSVVTPLAYVIPPSETELIGLLRRHRILMKKLEKSSEIELEIDNIRHVTETIEEEMTVPYVDISKSEKKINLKEGTIFIFLNQPAGNLIPLLLEPQSTIGIFSESGLRQNIFMRYLKEGTDYPVSRLLKPADVKLVDL